MRTLTKTLAGWIIIIVVLGGGLATGLPAQAQTSRVLLNIGWPWDPVNLDPAADWTQAGQTIRRLVYDSLLDYSPKGELIPSLATSWQASADGRVYTFKLRQGVKFHDGTTFDAAAAKYGLDRAIAVKGGPFSPLVGSVIESVAVVDNYTIRVTLKGPFGPFLSKMGAIWSRVFVCPQEARRAEVNRDMGARWLADNMCGTGPYRFGAWVRETRVVLRQFRDYWGGWSVENPIQVVNFQIVSEPSSRRLMIERGDLDIAYLIPVQDLQALDKKPGVRVLAYSDQPLVQYYLWMLSGRPPMNNVKVRQAISYAISYDKIANNILSGYAKPARGPLPAGMWGFDPTTPRYPRDLDKARTLLREAGLNQPTGITVRLMWFTGFEEQRLIVQQIQSDLAEIGITVQPLEATSAVARQLRQKLETAPEMSIFFTAPEVDPDDYLYRFHSGQTEPVGRNLGWYKNARVDQLLDQARALVDRRQRARIYSQVQRLLVEDAAAAYLFTSPTIIIMRDNISGFEYVPFYDIAFNANDMSKR
jgi:peptide/nickel transport system substrate-binding protein